MLVVCVARNRMVVPFRESKLTHLFMNHLAGAATGKTVMIVNINPQVIT
jgi:formaldehyde-activating enzyme involved in methanogenesis